MKKIVNKSIIAIIIFMIVISFSCNLFAETTVKKLQEEYPTGTQWNGTYYGMSPNSTQNHIIRIVATECAGFSALMYYNYYGFDPYYYANYVYDINQVKSGDIVRYQEDGQHVGHSVWVLSREGDMCTIAECNYDGSNTVRWGVKRSISELSYYFDHIMASDYEIGAEATFEPRLGTPESVNIVQQDKSITITWSPVPNATYYEVNAYRASDWESEVTTTPASTSIIDARVTALSIVLNDTDDYYVVVYARRGNYRAYEGGTAANEVITIGNPIREISASTPKSELEVGEKTSLNVELTPSNTDMDKKLTYTSSNINVLIVDLNGEVTAVGEGTATITIVTKNKIVAIVIIKVNPKPVSDTTDDTTITDTTIGDTTIDDTTIDDTTIDDTTIDDTTIDDTTTGDTTSDVVTLDCRTHVQDDGWHDYVRMGEKAGSEGRAKRMEAFQLRLKKGPYSGGIKYASHVENIGWQDYVVDNQISGTEGRAYRVEAIKIELTGEIAEHYDVYYRTHCENFGWLGWAKNGYAAGTAGQGLRMESMQIMLVQKNGSLPTEMQSNEEAYKAKLVGCSTHVQDYGWLPTVYDGQMSGTQGESKRMEAMIINLADPEFSGNIEYQVHLENIGWQQGKKKNGEMAGTTGESRRLEAITINLTGQLAEKYDIYYRTHCQNFGWLDWAKNGQRSGSEGYAYRLEAIEIVLVHKGDAAPGATQNTFKMNSNVQ